MSKTNPAVAAVASNNPPPLQPLYYPGELNPWWQYQRFPQDEISRINSYFETNKQAIDFGLGSSVKDNLSILASKIGVLLPPQLTQDVETTNSDLIAEKVEEKELSGALNDPSAAAAAAAKAKQEEQQSVDPSQKLQFFIVNSIKLDYVTIKLLGVAMLAAKIRVIRMNNCTFDDNTLAEFENILQKVRIVKLFFDWNDLQQCSEREQFYVNLFKNYVDLEMLTIRKCNIGDALVSKFVETLISNASLSKIKFIDLFQNQISNEGAIQIGRLLQEYQKLCYLGLGGNPISNYNPLLKNIGKRIMTPEDVLEHKKLEAERDAIVQKNLKNKGKAQEEVPVIPLVRDIGGDKLAWILNEQLQVLNLISTEIREADRENIENFLVNSLEGFTLSLSAINFEKKTIDRLRKKFAKKINFS